MKQASSSRLVAPVRAAEGADSAFFAAVRSAERAISEAGPTACHALRPRLVASSVGRTEASGMSSDPAAITTCVHYRR